jgi:hypothetical protein
MHGTVSEDKSQLVSYRDGQTPEMNRYDVSNRECVLTRSTE